MCLAAIRARATTTSLTSRNAALKARKHIQVLRMAPATVTKAARRNASTTETTASGGIKSTLPPGYKEDLSKGPMLRFEDSLPRLPVPTLAETATRYLASVRPLLNDTEYANTKTAVNDFVRPSGPGETLQARLLARRNSPTVRNWIYDWWNDAAYLAVREPVVPYVSYFYSHRDDRRRRDPAKRAAALTLAALHFKNLVDERTLEPEYMRKVPLAMASYEWMFNACRIPREKKDYPIKYQPLAENAHIVVIRKNQFWKVKYAHDDQTLNAAELEVQFRRIYERAERQPPVGLLTTQNRDVWAEARERLLKADESNAAALEAIQSSAFVVCLDDASPVTLEERAHQYWHGDGSNRWFDKPCQFIVNDNGTSGFMGEHSMMDGTPTHRLNDTCNALIHSNALPQLSETAVRSNLPDPIPLRFNVDDVSTDDNRVANLDKNTKVPKISISLDLHQAQQHFTAQFRAHDLRVQAYQGYGKGLIKRFGCSPDAYVQMLIQLAYHRLHGGRCRPTYESAATRRFQLGRTETCRSVSAASVSFCDAMADANIPPAEAVKRFRDALASHVEYIGAASAGKGVDRHLWGLRKCLHKEGQASNGGEETPAIYLDPAYAYSSKWFLSTSQLSSEYFNGYGWSQVVDEGFGIAYMINENSIQFNVVCRRDNAAGSNAATAAERMSHHLAEAASDVRDLLLPTLHEGGTTREAKL